jgi:hypothetical protein
VIVDHPADQVRDPIYFLDVEDVGEEQDCEVARVVAHMGKNLSRLARFLLSPVQAVLSPRESGGER